MKVCWIVLMSSLIGFYKNVSFTTQSCNLWLGKRLSNNLLTYPRPDESHDASIILTEIKYRVETSDRMREFVCLFSTLLIQVFD